jgi:putative tricarboxylic transport membrane protein
VSIAEAAWQGFLLVFSWPNILYPTVATLLAMVFAFLPGLSGITLMALAISLTFHWEPLPVVLIFGAFTGGATFMGSITAILFNIPGTAPSAATMIDGHPMALQGKARTAIACSATASALGSTIGVALFIALLPLLRRFILAFGPAEMLMFAIWGLATIAAFTGRSLPKGLAAAALGLLFATIGFDPRTAELRFTFGWPDLHDGLNVIPVFLGLFAVAEALRLAAGARSLGGARLDLRGSMKEGILAPFRHFGLLVRSSITGTVVGMIPAAGGTVAGFLAYGQAAQSARDNSQFGKGDIRGVLAPEAAHDAKDGGSLAPTLVLGVPGNEGTALLLAALTLHGIVPGPELLTAHLPLVFALVWSLFYSNWLTSLLGLALTRPLHRLPAVRLDLLAPFILLFAVLGAYAARQRFSDVLIAFAFGLLGYFFKRFGWPTVPLVTALVLGPIFEINLHLTRGLHHSGRIDFFARPLVWILAVLMILMFAWPRLRSVPNRIRQAVQR